MNAGIFVAAALSATLAMAERAVPIANLVNESDLILVADILDRAESADGVTVMLSMNRALKGVAPKNRLMAVSVSGVAAAVSGDRALWFLKRDASGEYRALPVAAGPRSIHSYFYEIPGGGIRDPFRYLPVTPVTEKVLMEIACATEQSAGKLHLERLAEAAAGLAEEETRMVFERFARSELPELRSLGAAYSPGGRIQLSAIQPRSGAGLD